jgi:hypothetical protein
VDENDFITLSLRLVELGFVLEDSGEDCVLSIDEDCGSAGPQASELVVSPCRAVLTDASADWILGAISFYMLVSIDIFLLRLITSSWEWATLWFKVPLPLNPTAEERSDDNAAIPLNPNAASSCGRSGRDFLRFICRRFWNHIYKKLKSGFLEDK